MTAKTKTIHVAAVAAIAAALCGSAAAADRPRLELHYAPAENLEAIDVATIDGAGETLDVAAYVLTDVAVIDAMETAAERGVKVRVFRDPSQAGHGGETVARALDALLAAPGVEQRFNTRLPWMHLKAYLVDGRTLRFGAANLSASGLKQQDNDLLLTDDPELIKRFQSEFETLWRRP